MGKDLKGKELGIGLSQRKDGRYSARFVKQNGKRTEKYFWKLPEAKKWLLDAKYEDEHCSIYSSSKMTVDTWFQYWIKEIKGPQIRASSTRNYYNKYKKHIGPVLGNMIISEVRPLHCQNVLNIMFISGNYAIDTINQVRMSLHAIFEGAVDNEFITKNPVTKKVSIGSVSQEPKKKRVLTLEEQKRFFEIAKSRKARHYYQYVLMVQTGMRIGEVVGLRWQDVDFDNRIIAVNQNMQWNSELEEFVVGPPKSEQGVRKIPMTETVYHMLKLLEEKHKSRKVYSFMYSDIVFVDKEGIPIKNITYNGPLTRLAKKAGIERVTPHVFRHTFATRCIEAGMRPKTLQKILGHSTLHITMNLYVHVSEEEKNKEMQKFEKYMSGDYVEKMA